MRAQTFLDLFCGCGGFTLGMIHSGLRCLAAIDIDPVVDLESDNLIGVNLMRDKTISATEAARSFSEVLNQVQYRDRSFSIERGSKVVARLVPPALPAGLALADLNRLFAGLPHLGPAEASRWRAEVRTMRRARRPQVRKWA